MLGGRSISPAFAESSQASVMDSTDHHLKFHKLAFRTGVWNRGPPSSGRGSRVWTWTYLSVMCLDSNTHCRWHKAQGLCFTEELASSLECSGERLVSSTTCRPLGRSLVWRKSSYCVACWGHTHKSTWLKPGHSKLPLLMLLPIPLSTTKLFTLRIIEKNTHESPLTQPRGESTPNISLSSFNPIKQTLT